MENEHKQITLPHLQNSMLRAKRYVDDQATANVIRTATTLWSGTQTYPRSTNTPVNIVTIDANTSYSTFWGEVVGGVPLSTRADVFDALEVGYWVINTTGGNKTYTNFYTLTMPVSQLYDPTNNRYRIFYDEPYGIHLADGSNDERVAFSVGLMSTTRLGLRGFLTYPNREIEFTYVKGISYSTEENYSTDEQVVGTWIDGKPLYQRTIQITLPSNLTNNVSYIVLYEAVGHEFISGEGYVEYNDGSVIGRVSIGYGSFVVSSETDATRFLWNGDKTYLAIRGSHFKGRPAIATIKYTKASS